MYSSSLHPAAERRSDLLCSLLCAFSAFLVAMLTLPFVDSAVNDDFSFAYTVQNMLRTGHLTYNGWGEMIIGPQAYWGALFCRILGFSFFTLRLSVMTLTAGCAGLFYSICRHLGLARTFTVCITLAFVTSPLLTPLSASFMTDVPGLFGLLLTLWCFVQAGATHSKGEPPSYRQALVWIVLGTVTGFLNGLIRQVFWLPTIALLLHSTLLLSRTSTNTSGSGRTTRVFGPILLLATLLLAGGIVCQKWYAAQPFSVVSESPTVDSVLNLFRTPWLLRWAYTGLLQICALTLPLLLVVAPRWQVVAVLRGKFQQTLPPWVRPACVLALLLTVIVEVQLLEFLSQAKLRGFNDLWPYWGNVLTIRGTYYETCGLPILLHPVVVPPAVCTILLLGVLTVSTLALGSAEWWLLCKLYPPARSAETAPAQTATARLPVARAGIQQIYVTLFAYGIGLIARLIFPTGVLYDRYLLAPIGFILLLLALRYQRVAENNVADRGRATAAIALGAIFAFYGIATTHDYFAYIQAGIDAAHVLQKRGVPRQAISGGIEFDCWTQLEAVGYVNSDRMRIPPEVSLVQRPVDGLNAIHFTANETPVVQPRFLLLTHPLEGITTHYPSPPVVYHAWLPPFQRMIFTAQMPPPQMLILYSYANRNRSALDF